MIGAVVGAHIIAYPTTNMLVLMDKFGTTVLFVDAGSACLLETAPHLAAKLIWQHDT